MLVWFHLHRYCLFVCKLLSTAGSLVALVVKLGFSDSLHSFFGVATIVLGLLQLISSFRGSRGGKYGVDGRLNEEASWRGDHHDTTPRLRWFETVNKQMGYLTLFMAFGAVATGLRQFWIPEIGIALMVLLAVAMICLIVFEDAGGGPTPTARVTATIRITPTTAIVPST